MKDNMVEMVALWDFSGPEGAGGKGRGLVRRGQRFFATPARSGVLVAAQKARIWKGEPVPPQPGPERVKPDGPEGYKPDVFVYNELTAAEVMERVEAGHLTPQQALELERDRETQRTTLIGKLNRMVEG